MLAAYNTICTLFIAKNIYFDVLDVLEQVYHPICARADDPGLIGMEGDASGTHVSTSLCALVPVQYLQRHYQRVARQIAVYGGMEYVHCACVWRWMFRHKC